MSLHTRHTRVTISRALMASILVLGSACTSPCDRSIAEVQAAVDYGQLADDLETEAASIVLPTNEPMDCQPLVEVKDEAEKHYAGYQTDLDALDAKDSEAQKTLEAKARNFQDAVAATTAVMALSQGQTTTLDGRPIAYPGYLKPQVQAVVGARYEKAAVKKNQKGYLDSELTPARVAAHQCLELIKAHEVEVAASEAQVESVKAMARRTRQMDKPELTLNDAVTTLAVFKPAVVSKLPGMTKATAELVIEKAKAAQGVCSQGR